MGLCVHSGVCNSQRDKAVPGQTPRSQARGQEQEGRPGLVWGSPLVSLRLAYVRLQRGPPLTLPLGLEQYYKFTGSTCSSVALSLFTELCHQPHNPILAHSPSRETLAPWALYHLPGGQPAFVPSVDPPVLDTL